MLFCNLGILRAILRRIPWYSFSYLQSLLYGRDKAGLGGVTATQLSGIVRSPRYIIHNFTQFQLSQSHNNKILHPARTTIDNFRGKRNK